MNRIRNLLLKHWHAVIAAFFVACIAGLPQIIVRNALGPADNGVPYLVNDSEGEYLSRIHEVLDGHIFVASPTLFEYKNSLTLALPTGELLFYVIPIKLTGLSLHDYVTVSRFLLPALLFVFAYLFVLSLLTRQDLWARLSAMAGALLVTIGYDVLNYSNVLSILLHGSTSVSGLLWTRLVNPVTGGILLFAYLWLINRIASEKGGARTVGVASLMLACMIGYVFSFAIALAVPVFIAIYFSLRRNWALAGRILIPFWIALLADGIYLLAMIVRAGDSAFISDPRRAGMFMTHVPLMNMIVVATLLGAATCFRLFYTYNKSKERENRWWFLSLAVLLACGLAYTQQVVTGMTIWPQHFSQYTKVLCLAIIVVYGHNVVRSRAESLWRVVVVGFLILAVLLGLRSLEAASENTIPKYAELQSFSGVFRYLNENAPKDCAVYVSPAYPSEINRFIPALTGCNVYHTFYLYSGVPTERIMHNYLVNLRLREIKMKDVREHVLSAENIYFVTKSYFFRDWNDIFCCRDSWLGRIGEKQEIDDWYQALASTIESNYSEFLKKDLYSELMRYRLDYFVVDTELQPQVSEKNFPFLSFKGQFGRFRVYTMIKSEVH